MKLTPPKEYTLMPLRDLQLLLLDSMKEIHSFLVQNSITYYIIAGTFLGSIRHGGFIPWDDDIDIAMMREDYEKFTKIAPQQLNPQKYFIQNSKSDVDFWYPLSRICIKDTFLDYAPESHLHYCKNVYIDVFPLDNVPEDLVCQNMQEKRLKRLIRLAHYKYYSILPHNNSFQIFLKWLISKTLSFYPLRSVEDKIQKEMTRFKDMDTKCVCSMASHYSYKKQTMPRDYYAPPRLYKFEDTELYGPSKAEEYLSQLYGDHYMSIPEKDKRRKPTPVYRKG